MMFRTGCSHRLNTHLNPLLKLIRQLLSANVGVCCPLGDRAKSNARRLFRRNLNFDPNSISWNPAPLSTLQLSCGSYD
jgi:hypothetical protein